MRKFNLVFMFCGDLTDIFNRVEYMKDNDDVKKCGTTYLSNSCHVTLNYCTSCKSQH
jgi:hypothetical protein